MSEILNKARREHQAQMRKKQDVLYTVPGIMGRPSDEALDVSTRPGYIWVRIGSEERLGQARCRTVKRYDLTCILGYDGITDEFQVLRIRQESYLLAGYDEIPEVQQHGITHSWAVEGEDTGGDDLSYTYWPQIMNFRPDVAPTSGPFYVKVEGGYLPRAAGVIELADQEIDLSGDQPGSGVVWVMVFLDASGTIQRTVGANLAAHVIATTDMPRPNAGEYEVCQVLLWVSQTQVQYDRDRQDIVDRRFPQTTSADPWGSETWENVRIVAKAGGQYDTVQAGIDACSSDDMVWVLPGAYSENITGAAYSLTSLPTSLGGLRTLVSGSNDTGPAVTIGAGATTIRTLAIMRTLSGGAGEYVLVDADAATGAKYLFGCWIAANGGAQARDLVALSISGQTSGGTAESTVRSSTIKAENSATSNIAVDLTGGDVKFVECNIVGDVVATAATDLTLRNCHIDGDLTGTAGATLHLEGHVSCTGTISGWDSITGDKVMFGGNVGIGSPAVAGVHLLLQDTAVSTTTDYYGVYEYHTKTGGATDHDDDLMGWYNHIELNQAAGEIGNFYGIRNFVVVTDGSVGDGVNTRDLFATYNVARVSGGIVTNRVRGGLFHVDADTGTITGDIAGGWFNVDIEAGMTAVDGNVYGVGIKLDDAFGAAAAYMLYLEEGIGVTHGIYQNGSAPHYFGGSVGIGVASPDRLLHSEVANTDTALINYSLRLSHSLTSGAAAALFGVGEEHELEDSAGNMQVASETVTLWATPTTGAESPLLRSTTYPIGTAGPGYQGFWTWTALAAAAITVIPNGGGDVVEAATFTYVVSAVTAGDASGGVVVLEPSDSFNIYDDGTDVCTIAVAADGSVTVQRTAGADTFDVAISGVWI